MVAEKDSKEIHINTQKLNTTCTVFQAKLYGISMAIEWIQNQGKKTYAINVNSKAALLAIANKHTTHPLAVAIKVKAIKLRNSNSITFHWVKGHAGLKGNERADYLAKTVDTYNTTIAYDHYHHYQSRKANTGRPLHKNLERNIWKLCKCLPHKTVHTHHLPQTFPSFMAQLPSQSVPNKSRQLPFIPSQNEQDALSKLQLS